MAFEITKLDNTQIHQFHYPFRDIFYASGGQKEFELSHTVVPYSETIFVSKDLANNYFSYSINDKSLVFFDDFASSIQENAEIIVYYSTYEEITFDTNNFYVFFTEIGEIILTDLDEPIIF